MNQRLLWLVAASLLFGCKPSTPQDNAEAEAEQAPALNTLTDAEKKDGWELLFDGQTTNGWHVYNRDTMEGWAVENGELIALGTGGLNGHGADIVSNEKFENFDLSLEWKVSPAGNSGVFFNVVEDPKYGAIYETAPEYQLIDDVGFPEKLEPWQHSAANYAMHPPAKSAAKPVGEFNLTRIVVNKGHVEHYLNGELIVSYDLWTPEWTALTQSGKWKDFPDYGKAKSGPIGLQDHGNKIWFRNIKIKRL